MSKILFAIFVFILIAYVDGSEVYKAKDTREIAVYTSIFLAVVIFSLLLINDIKIPNPIEPIQAHIISIFGKN